MSGYRHWFRPSVPVAVRRRKPVRPAFDSLEVRQVPAAFALSPVVGHAELAHLVRHASTATPAASAGVLP